MSRMTAEGPMHIGWWDAQISPPQLEDGRFPASTCSQG